MKFLITKLTAISLLLLLVLSFGCQKNFLDQKTLSIINENAVFSDSTLALQFVNSRYANLSNSWDPAHLGGQAGFQVACDEAYSNQTSTANAIVIIKSGGLNAANVYSGNTQNVFATTYTYVRACNIFLKNKNKIPVKPITRKRWEGEIRFLRAWNLFILFKHSGGLPLVKDSVFDGDRINIARSTYEETVNYLAAECDSAAAKLPLSYLVQDPNDPLIVSPNDYGRITKGAALALKSRLLLYAASPLFNDGTRTDDPNHLVSYATADNNRWKKAADAAKAVIDQGTYSLYRGASPYFQTQFYQIASNEQILVRNRGNNTYLEVTCAWNPSSRGGYNASVPTQEMVDAFGMQNGKAITDPTSGYSGTGDNMYLNRDPRFYYSISYNGSPRYLNGYANAKVWTYLGVEMPGTTLLTQSVRTDKIYLGTSTGYYTFKMLYDQAVPSGSQTPRPDPLIRYAEILLNAAEAYNEYYGPSANVYGWLTDIRDRAGITKGADGLYGLKANMTKDEMRAAIWAERRVELAFEEHRYWDIRRWKIAPTVMNGEVHGMEITRNASGAYTYNTIVVFKNIFTTASYFWPIPISEITKSPKIIQNPGY